jgi:hypothetical protein
MRDAQDEGNPVCRYFKEDVVLLGGENEALINDALCINQRQPWALMKQDQLLGLPQCL